MGEIARSFPAEGTQRTESVGAGSPGAAGQPLSTEAGRVGGEAEGTASAMTGQAKDIVKQRVSQRATRSADDLDDVARALHRTTGELGDNVAAPYVDRAAEQIERFARFLRTSEPGQMVRSAESFARREPLLFLGGAFALGIVAARFLKSSERHGEYRGEYRRLPGGKEYGQTTRSGS